MAELTCKDGTRIQISDETEQELRKAFGEKTYPVGTWFLSDHYKRPIKLDYTKDNYRGGYSNREVALYSSDEFLRRTADPCHCCGKEIVKDVRYVPFSVIQKLTMYPEGLRAIKGVKIIEDN
jgi:hypothetical protein